MATNKAKRKRHKRMLAAKARKKAVRCKRKQGLALKYADYLNEFNEFIFGYYKPLDADAYRWVHNPLIPDDSLPQIFQENDSRCVDDLNRPSADDPVGVVLDYVGNFTLSNYDTLEHAEEVYQSWVDKFAKRKDAKERIRQWIEKVGIHIVRVHYSPDVAVCSPIEEDGHFEALLAESTDWEKLVDQTFKPYRINIKYDEA